MRSITHPGTPEAQRLVAVATGIQHVETMTRTGVTLLDALTDIADKQGIQSGALRLKGGAFTSFNYVMPALSKSPEHAVYFSDTHHVAGTIQLETASVTWGRRDGAPWLHCHAVWIEPDGRRHCGHLLPDQIMVASPIAVSGVSLNDATFTVTPDAETNFSLFVPQTKHSESVHTSQSAYALRVAPNEDLCLAIEQFCATKGIKTAELFGGVGSIVGAVFQDGRVVEPFVTELLIRSGRVALDKQGHPSADIDITLVDYLGGVAEGRLARGANPVLVTAELVLAQLS